MASVLVVDDNEDVRLLVGKVLSSAGFDVREVAGAREAFLILSEGPAPDLVVLDIQMPEVDGWEVLRMLRAQPGTSLLPVILCTVKAGPADVARGWELGCDGFLAKPFDIFALKEEVRAVVARSPVEREIVRRRAVTLAAGFASPPR